MKINREELDKLRAVIAPLDTEATRTIYRSGEFDRADLTQDLNKRYHWDLLEAAGGWRISCDLYDRLGVNDAHIDTALRAIVPTL